MAGTLGELFVELGVFADTEELKAFEQKLANAVGKMDKTEKKSNKLTLSIGKFIKQITLVAGAISGAIYALNRLATSLIESNQEFLNLTRTSDISLGTFQKWNNVGRMLGVRNAAQQIENLNQRLFELKLTGQGAEGFMLAGINPMGQDAEGIMEQLRNRIAGLDDTAAAYLLRQMGLDPSMLHLLRLTKEEFDELGQTVKKYQLTSQQTKQIQAFNVQLQITQIRLKYLKDRAILAIMPYFVRFMKFIADVTEAFAMFVKWLKEGKTAGAVITKVLLGIAVAIGAITTALWLLTAHPIIAGITLLIGALMLLADDFRAFYQGEDSLIGHILNAIDGINNAINFETPKWIKDLLYIIQNINNLAKAIRDIKNGRVGQGDAKVDAVQVGKNLAVGGLKLNPLLNKLIPNIPVVGSAIKLYNALQEAMKNEEALKNNGYGANTPAVQNNTNNNRTNNISKADNRQVIMNNQITTFQTGDAVINDLSYAQNYAFDFA